MSRLILSAVLLVSTATAFTTRSPFSPPRVGWLSVLDSNRDNDPMVRNAGGMLHLEVQEAPLLFHDDLLNDMQLALLAMEKRIQEGPNSLSQVQVAELEERLQRIVKDMRENAHKRPAKPVRTEDHDNQAQAGTLQSASAPLTQSSRAPHAETIENKIMDTSMDEGPLYDGRGGMGQPKGTVNTYIIEGMDEMTTDEYRLALQQSIIDRQTERRQSGAALGGRGTSDYFSSLGSQGGMFKNQQ